MLGLGLLAVLVIDNDPRTIAASIARLSWRLAIIVTFPAILVNAVDALGWRYAFLRNDLPLTTLFSVRVIGEAFNMATPTATLGGEAMKSWLLRGRLPMSVTLPSVIVAKTTITIGQALLLMLGVLLARATVAAHTPLLVAMQWLVVIEALALGTFAVAQTRGLLGRSSRLLQRLGVQPPTATGEALGRVDDVLARFYREHPGRLTLSIAFHFAGWLLGAVETWLILDFLGVPVSLLTAIVIEAFGMAIRAATFLIPGNIGALEGGYAATFAVLGLGSTIGVTFSLVRRIREVTWIALGLLLFAIMRPAAETTAAADPTRSI
ncbi:MAG TPA: flippase-like domain-containing protein [Methylomirabilota bacterium]|nr:flippase-like domain-containing protein [Methylomirabilota bacterium]